MCNEVLQEARNLLSDAWSKLREERVQARKRTGAPIRADKEENLAREACNSLCEYLEFQKKKEEENR